MTKSKNYRSIKKLVNIRRIDYPQKSTYGWFVQVERKGITHKKFFSDSLYRNKKDALAAAILFRDGVKQPDKNKYVLWRRSIVRKNNTSGIVGVARYVRSDNKKGIESPYWQAFWNDVFGKRKSKKFSVSRYGEEQARLLAIRERKKQLSSICK